MLSCPTRSAIAVAENPIYLTELTEQLKRLESIEKNNDVLENIKYLLKLIDKMGGSNIKETPK